MLGNFLGRYCKTAGFLKAVVEGLFPGQKVSLLGVSKNLKADVQHADTSELCKLRWQGTGLRSGHLRQIPN